MLTSSLTSAATIGMDAIEQRGKLVQLVDRFRACEGLGLRVLVLDRQRRERIFEDKAAAGK